VVRLLVARVHHELQHLTLLGNSLNQFVGYKGNELVAVLQLIDAVFSQDSPL
jgi:hypothetical protein